MARPAAAQQPDGAAGRWHARVARAYPEQFAGPGEAHVGYGEYNQRHLLSRWADYLERPAAPAPQVQVMHGQRRQYQHRASQAGQP